MTDVVSPEKRRAMMAGIKGKNTKPEITVRKALHKVGFRYRLYDKKLPGKPDLVLPKYKAVIFVNGCFWHGHDCHLFKWPQTRKEFWRKKINGNKIRDAIVAEKYKQMGWRRLVVWECAIKGKNKAPLQDLTDEIAGWLTCNISELKFTESD